MSVTVGVVNRPVLGNDHRLDSPIQHRVDELSIWMLPMHQLMTMPSMQSMIVKRHTLPAGIWNSVMSVRHFSFEAAACKSLLMMFSGAGLISPK